MMEIISEATDVYWVKKPKGEVLKRLKRAIVVGRADVAPIPYMAARACVADEEPIGYIVSKLNMESPVQTIDNFHSIGWSMWIKDEVLIISAPSLPSIDWLIQNTSNAWLYCYQPIRDACSVIKKLDIGEMTFLTTPYLNEVIMGGEKMDEADFFLVEVEPDSVKLIVTPTKDPFLDLPAWLFAWVFTCMGGTGQIAGCGGSKISRKTLKLFSAFLRDLGVEATEENLNLIYGDFENIEKAIGITESVVEEIKNNSGGVMYG
tara:strand:- start:162 stop:947 length:786 start_codon:yes stop_codon:yes gene_type:complete